MIDIVNYWPELLSVTVVAIFMSISPGPDFVMIARNSIFHGRRTGLYSSLGIAMAIWLHVAYSIAGLAVIISNSLLLFSIIKYLGAAYLIYIGWTTLKSNTSLDVQVQEKEDETSRASDLGRFEAFKIGFVTNALNPKTTIFFLSIFTQVVSPDTPIFIQIIYGLIISICHFVWFGIVALFLSQPRLLKLFQSAKRSVEVIVGSVLIGFGVKVATTNH